MQILRLYPSFFGLACTEVIANVGEYENRPPSNYDTIEQGENVQIIFNHKPLAERCSKFAASKVIQAHKDAIKQFSKVTPGLASNVLDSYYAAEQLMEKLIMML
jgi:hypothetical protein